MINTLSLRFPLPATTTLWEEDDWRRSDDPVRKVALLALKIFLTLFTVSIDLILQMTNRQAPIMRKARDTTLLSAVEWGLDLLDPETKKDYLELLREDPGGSPRVNIYEWAARCSEIQAIIRNPTSKNYPYKEKKEAFALILLHNYQSLMSSPAQKLAKEIRQQSFALHQNPDFINQFKKVRESLNQ